MRKRGRPATYTPQPYVSDSSSESEHEPNMAGAMHALTIFAEFCRQNSEQAWISDTATSVRFFGKQMEKQGLDPGTITTTLGHLASYRVSSSDPYACLPGLKLFAFKKGLTRKKARAGNAGKKPLLSLEAFAILWSPTEVQEVNERDLMYMTFWWLLVATGARPCNVLTGKCLCTKTSLKFWYCGLKNDQHASAAAREYLYSWSTEPPLRVKHFLAKKGVPKLGTEKNIAANLNSWAQKRLPDVKISSTMPRVRLDNILSALVRENKMKESEFMWLMNHGMETSDRFYRR